MGAGNSTELRINFDRPNLFYYGGDQVSGTVIFQNTQDKVTVDTVMVEFTGELGYTTQETRQVTDGDNNTRSESYTENHTVTFIKIAIPVAKPQYGQVRILHLTFNDNRFIFFSKRSYSIVVSIHGRFAFFYHHRYLHPYFLHQLPIRVFDTLHVLYWIDHGLNLM